MRNIAPYLAAGLLVFAGNVAALGEALAQDTTAAPTPTPPLTVCLPQAPMGLDPGRAPAGSASVLVSRAVFDTLVALGEDGTTIVPQLARRWDISPDRRQYTFRLRGSVAFHKTPIFEPSRPLGADDVVFTFERLIDPAHPMAPTGAGGRPATTELAATIQSVESLGSNEVRFTLKAPQSGFLMMLADTFAAIQPAEYGAKLLAARQGWMLDTHPVGSGAFSVKTIAAGANAAAPGPRAKPAFEVIAGAAGPIIRTLASIPVLSEASTRQRLKRIELSANEIYWQGPPNSEKLIIDIEPDIATRFGRLTSGQCQIMPGPDEADIEALDANPEVKLTETRGTDTLYLAFNTEQEPVDDKWVRLALAEAIDVDALARLKGIYGTPARAIVQDAGETLPVERHTSSLDFARSHLAGAGAEAPNLRLLAPVATTDGATPLADAIAGAWEKLDAKVTIDKVLWADMATVLAKGDYDVALLAWRADGADLARNYRKLLSCEAIGNTNASRWCDKSFMADLKSIADASNPADRKAATIKAAQRVASELPILPLAHLKQRWAVRTEVMGLDAAALGASNLTQAMIRTVEPMGGPLADPDIGPAPGETVAEGDAG
ncbi:hypothetical protein MNBD_ALPHA09-2154 [hydrothermal vent metagenome]|uniref:Solute-binding protein family 5 domain-containing protein n=1 Tax=hydrothermal vent metagenome TaxID=652676 RepID=A0A3B0T0R9_9ZZZZ